MTRVLTVLLASVLLAAPAANAQQPQTNAPPGNSAIDEYLETVPGATGNRPPNSGSGKSRGDTPLTAAQRARLERLGPDGKSLAGVVDSTSPSTGRATAPAGAAAAPEGEGRSPLGQAVVVITGGDDGGGGMGLLLPAILLASLLAAIALALTRRRSAS